ncbi:MAG: zinc-dependent alcohol dehydrogenase [Limnochordia bacterium]|jgi:2-desacetyl-2-hydroxyethyl bacteriochlorophyllide A dehydrogenase|nr:alcohol dehydrogenase catalytic domain-containing protein [Bacillota bacterium]
MRAAVLKENYRIVLEDVKEPSPGPGEVKIQVRVTGICGSEVHAFKGTHPYRKPPVILGHELAGDIVEVGSDVEGLKVGDRVTVEPQIGCERCYMCRRGLNNLCESKIVLGTQEWPGSFAEYIIAPAKVVYRLPDGLSYEEGVMVEPLAVGVHAVRWSEMGLGDSVLVLGAGTIGLVTIMAARQAGARRIFATDVLDFNLAKARELGATHTINVRQKDPVSVVLEETKGKGADVAFITAAASPVVEQAIKAVRKRGKALLIGFFEGPADNLEIFPLTAKEIDLRGCLMYTAEGFQNTLDMVAEGQLDSRPLITEVLDIAQAQEGLEVMDKRTRDAVKILLKF